MAQTQEEMPKASSVKQNSEKKKLTAAEMKKYIDELERKNFAKNKSSEAFKQLRDVSKNVRQTSLSSYDKESVITYLQNIDRYEKELRGLSRYLFYRSQVYFRLIMYNATMFDLNSRYVVPPYDPTKENDKDSILKSYYETLKILDTMDLQNSLLPMLVNNFIEDVFYGCCWIDETGICILKIPPENAKISGKYFTGDFSFYVDMSYYKKFEDIIELLGEPLSSMYEAYGNNNANKWQPMPDEYALCTKARPESWETVVPVYSGLFLDLIGLLNLSDIQSITNEQQIYKLITATIPTLKNVNEPDAWAVDIDLALDYYNKFVDEIPGYIGSVITPIPLDVISFPEDQASDTTKVQKATKELFNTSGGSQVLDTSGSSSAESLRLASKSDTELAVSSLLGQIQGWVNRILSYHVSKPAKVKFFEVSTYTKDALKESLQKELQYDNSMLLVVNSLNGISELDTLSLNYLTNDILNLSQRIIPPVSAATVSHTSDEGGAPEKSDTEISDAGLKSRETS